MLVSQKKPCQVLEIGFGSGASGAFLADCLPANGSIISLERDLNRFNRGRALLSHFKLDQIKLLHKDALLYLKNEADSMFDFIFLDAVKREYIDYIPLVKKRLNPGGLLVTDNILFNGKIVEEQPDKKYVNGLCLLKEFNKTLAHDPDFSTTFLETGDGMALSVKV